MKLTKILGLRCLVKRAPDVVNPNDQKVWGMEESGHAKFTYTSRQEFPTMWLTYFCMKNAIKVYVQKKY